MIRLLADIAMVRRQRLDYRVRFGFAVVFTYWGLEELGGL